MRIAIDLDGVVVDTYGEVVNYYNEYFNTEYDCNIFPSHTKVSKYLHEYHNLSLFEAKSLWKQDMKIIFENAKPIKNAQEVIKKLSCRYDICYITARPGFNEIEEITKNWLITHQFPKSNQLYIDHLTKDRIAKDLNIDVFIEDAPHQIIQLANSNIQVIVLKTGYNESIQHINCHLVNDWLEIDKVIKELEGMK